MGRGQHVETVATDCEAGEWDDSRPIRVWVSPGNGGVTADLWESTPRLGSRVLPLLAGSLPSSVSRGSSVPLNRGLWAAHRSRLCRSMSA